MPIPTLKQVPVLGRRHGLWVLVAGLVLAVQSPLAAQDLVWNPGAMIATGIERSAGQGGSAARMSPLFLDLNLRTYADDGSTFLVGGSLRTEFTGIGAVGLVPRVEIETLLGPIALRPGVGFDMYVAPLTLFGPEVSLDLQLPLAPHFNLQALLFMAIYLLGNNLPEDTTLIQLGGGLGFAFVL